MRSKFPVSLQLSKDCLSWDAVALRNPNAQCLCLF